MTSLDRQAPCPNCGAPMIFKFAGARAQVCEYCKFVVARTDRGLVPTGRMADLIEIPTPFTVGTSGRWHGDTFTVEGRIQMDRAGAPGAPWQEILLAFLQSDRSLWVAYAQGRWYATSEQPLPPEGLPPPGSLRPGSTVNLGQYGAWVVQEVGQRRVVSGEGALTLVPAPGVATHYADISAQGGQFGTIDYGDGSQPPKLFLGKQFDPREVQLESGMPVEMPEAKAAAVECPNCGGTLPLMSQQAERVICQYCGTASDVNQGVLSALGPSPKPPIQPYIPLGSEGVLRGNKYIVAGFMIRSTRVEGETYSWREYLLFGGEAVGYRWLMEEDGKWSFIEPVETGDIVDSGHGLTARGAHYSLKQQVHATVDYVMGEFYWKVEIGETVEAAEFGGAGGKLSRERSETEVVYTFMSPLEPRELAAFGVSPPAGAAAMDAGTSTGGPGQILMTMIVMVVICLVIAMVAGGACGGSSVGGPSYGGGGWGK